METDRSAPSSSLQRAVDATAGRAAAAALGAASFLRQRRIFHPDGVALEATLTISPERRSGSRLLDDPGEHACIVRLSRGIGLPETSPDVMGVAIRVRTEGVEQDLLFASVAGDGPVGHHVLAPAATFASRPLSTVLPYRTSTSLLTLLLKVPEPDARGLSTLDASAQAFGRGSLTFELQAEVRGDGRSSVGRLTGRRLLRKEAAEDLRYNPFNAAHDLQPAGGFNAMRRRAYRSSQSGRPTTGWSPDRDGLA